MSNSHNALLQLHNVSFGYDAPNIATDIHIHIHAQERVALTGQNGVGKTSLLQSVMGITPFVEGKITFENTSILGMPAHDIAKRGVSLVSQEHAVFADLSVSEHFQVLDKKNHEQLLEEYLVSFPELLNKRKTRAKNLSGGQRQQLAVALALATKPKLLLLDEPSANIQPSIVESMIETIDNISRSTGMSLFVAEQNLLVIKHLTERAYVLEAGSVREDTSLNT